jgi:uncharacterized protein
VAANRATEEIVMNVVLYGATGHAGSRILSELTKRGHKVTAVARNLSKLPTGVPAKQDDLSNVDKTAAAIAGADAVVSAYGPPQTDPDQLIAVTERQIKAVKKAGKIRLIVVGGAASLEVAPGISLLASGHVPAEWMPIATSHEKALRLLEGIRHQLDLFQPRCLL